MPIIPSHPLPMELYVPRLLPSVPRHLICFIVLLYCASILPCSVCSNYEICQNTTCGSISFGYPFGVGNYGCGLPSFQIDCVENTSAVIKILGLNYTILNYYPNNSFTLVRNDNCNFIYDPFNIGSAFKITSTHNFTLYVYECSTMLPDLLKLTEGKLISECLADVYYSLYTLPGLSVLPQCTKRQVEVDVGMAEWLSTDAKIAQSCNSCTLRKGICGYDASVSSGSDVSFICYYVDGSVQTDKSSGHGKKTTNGAAIGGSVGAAVLIAAGIFVGIAVYRRRKNDCFRESLVVGSAKDDEYNDLEPGIEGKKGTLTIFSYELLKQATSDFDEKNQLGDGGFGSVYLGKLPDGRTVAVKRLHQDNSRRVEQFINEVEILSSFCHPNLVSLYGCTSPDSRDLLLVYEYVANGTLADHLHGKRKKDKGLNWDTRLKICIETAQALAFLHSLESPIFHRDVKSTNILLDEYFRVKVADFGLSRFVPLDATHISTAPQGTPGYVDPEYHQCFQLTDKSDVYSFGVVLMEIISGKVAVDTNRTRREIVLATMAIAKVQAGSLHELVDPKLDIEGNSDIKVMVSAVAELAFRCLAPEKDDRPNMKEVVAGLEQVKENGAKYKDPAFQPRSPTSVQEKWLSTRTTPENSASSL